MKNTINWFEIGTTDLNRATRFYEAILGVELIRNPSAAMSIFPAEKTGITGCLVRDTRVEPSAGGPRLFLNANGRLDAAIAKVTQAGGTVVTPKTDIGEHGHFALFRDTEGNVLGLHSER